VGRERWRDVYEQEQPKVAARTPQKVDHAIWADERLRVVAERIRQSFGAE
jgi:hypothetical protein